MKLENKKKVKSRVSLKIELFVVSMHRINAFLEIRRGNSYSAKNSLNTGFDNFAAKSSRHLRRADVGIKREKKF